MILTTGLMQLKNNNNPELNRLFNDGGFSGNLMKF